MKRLLLLSLLLIGLAPGATAQSRPIVIVAENYAPATFIDNGVVTGFDVDIAKAVFDHLGVSYEIQLVPWARAADMLKHGQADVGLHVSYTDERATFIEWPKTPVWDADFVLMTTKQVKAKYPVHNLDDVKRLGLRIGIIRNNAYHSEFWNAFPSPNREQQQYDPQIDAASDATTNLKKLVAGRIQVFPFPLILGRYMAHELQLHDLTWYDWTIFSKSYPNGFARASSYHSPAYPTLHALMEAYDEELARMKGNAAKYKLFFLQYQVVDDH